MSSSLLMDISVKGQKAVFSKIFIDEEKPIATFMANCWEIISRT